MLIPQGRQVLAGGLLGTRRHLTCSQLVVMGKVEGVVPRCKGRVKAGAASRRMV